MNGHFNVYFFNLPSPQLHRSMGDVIEFYYLIFKMSRTYVNWHWAEKHYLVGVIYFSGNTFGCVKAIVTVFVLIHRNGNRMYTMRENNSILWPPRKSSMTLHLTQPLPRSRPGLSRIPHLRSRKRAPTTASISEPWSTSSITTKCTRQVLGLFDMWSFAIPLTWLPKYWILMWWDAKWMWYCAAESTDLCCSTPLNNPTYPPPEMTRVYWGGWKLPGCTRRMKFARPQREVLNWYRNHYSGGGVTSVVKCSQALVRNTT